ncbi:MAG: pyrroline-5-carboxylate reductase [Calditrichaceae bacterium]|nr:pyrroline-5-carboxylate reductase [Calditrichaceae bacterium]RQV94117.1 MAG: pyrroline-5-carboxylate reductase [Calditrichota bacterium]
MKAEYKIAIIGAGNIGLAIAEGLIASKVTKSKNITLTRRKHHLLDQYEQLGFITTKNNIKAVQNSDIIILSVEPSQADGVLDEIAEGVEENHHLLISVVSGLGIKHIKKRLGKNIDIVRAMPNTAIAIKDSMTCLASTSSNGNSLKTAAAIFNTLGLTKVIREEQMAPATALAACGLAFFLRATRAASQGGIEIGFHAEDAIEIASQTAKGAAGLLLCNRNHPEFEIDKVTTPRGVTISGLNQMEHDGFSSAMIRGIVTSAEKASRLYVTEEDDEE